MNIDKKTMCLNLIAGPGAGKSTTAALVFGLLKLHGISCELIVEYPKDLIYEGRMKTFDNQSYVWAKQYHRLWRAKDHVDLLIVDSPLMIYHAYDNNELTKLKDLINESIELFDNITYYIRRMKPYVESGRYQTEEQAIQKDTEIQNVLAQFDVKYKIVNGNHDGVNEIVMDILPMFGKEPEILVLHKDETER